MKNIIMALTALLVCGAAMAAQDTDITPREVKDPKTLETWLEANATDAEARLVAGTTATSISNTALTLTASNVYVTASGRFTVGAGATVTIPATNGITTSLTNITARLAALEAWYALGTNVVLTTWETNQTVRITNGLIRSKEAN